MPEAVQEITPQTDATAEAEKPVVAVEATPETAEQKAERDKQGRFSKPADERIAEITRKHREAEREIAYWKGRAEGAAPAKPAVEAPKAPEAKDFEDYDAYVRALARFEAKEAAKTEVTEHDKARETSEAKATRQKQFRERLNTTAKEIPDYNDVMENAEGQVAEHVGELVEESDLAGRLLYHFAKNPDVLDRLNAMSPTAAAREVGKIEARIEAEATKTTDPEPEAEKPPVTPRKTNAPPPPKPLASGRSTVVDLGKSSMDEYKAARKAQGARWAR